MKDRECQTDLHHQRNNNSSCRAVHPLSGRRRTSVLALPPIPLTLIRAQSIFPLRACSGTKSRSHEGSKDLRVAVGGIRRSRIARAQAATCNGPLAPNGFPVTPLIEVTGIS